MKLLLTLDFAPERGGIQHYLAGVLAHCYSNTDRVLVGCTPGNVTCLDAKGAAVTRVTTPLLSRFNKKWSLAAMLYPYAAACVRHRGDLTVECANLYAALVAWMLYPLTRQPYSLYTYGTELVALQKESLKTAILRRVLRRAQTLYALGSYTTKLLRGLGAVQPVRIEPPRIALPPGRRDEVRQRDAEFKILCVARLVKHKGVDVLIRAVAKFSHDCPFRLRVVGQGPEFSALQRLRQAVGCTERITFAGQLTDGQLAEAYCAADVLVLPSVATGAGVEGFGIVLLEAMAFSVPIVASATGGIPDVLDNGECGLLVEPGSADALAQGLLRVWQEPGLARRLAHNASQRLLEHYVWRD